MDWKTTTFLILGLGRSGQGALDLILRLGGATRVYDMVRPEGGLGDHVREFVGCAQKRKNVAHRKKRVKTTFREPRAALAAVGHSARTNL